MTSPQRFGGIVQLMRSAISNPRQARDGSDLPVCAEPRTLLSRTESGDGALGVAGQSGSTSLDRGDALTVLYVCSSGGHLLELLSMHERWLERCPVQNSTRRYRWVTFKTPDAESLLAEHSVTWASYPTNRNLGNLWRNWRLAHSFMRDATPDYVISTGAGVAVPFLLEARRRGAATVYLESIARSSKLSMTGRMLYGRTDRFLVQWPELAEKFDQAEYAGQVL